MNLQAPKRNSSLPIAPAKSASATSELPNLRYAARKILVDPMGHERTAEPHH